MIRGMSPSSGQVRRRSYRQYCAVARALDVIGERWTLLIVRDLLMGPKRYTDLQEGLPGIPTDLLTARLRTLQLAGLVDRRTLPRPAPATVYELTERGRLLGPVVSGLARLGFEFLESPADDADLPAERLALSLRSAFHADAMPTLEATYQLELGAESFVVDVRSGRLDVLRGSAEDPDLILSTDPVTLMRILRREIAPDSAVDAGTLKLRGRTAALEPFITAFQLPCGRALRPSDGKAIR
jgi:DNA-binding HxlR family transcriptional regulator/putative sterol carrier protein